MACDAEVLKNVPLFALLDDDETAVLASQVELKKFAARERIYKIGDPGGPAYVMLSGKVRVATVDEDQQEVVIDEPAKASSSASPPCWNKRPPDQRYGHRGDGRVWKSPGTTSPFCCSASRWREWIC